MLCKIAPFWHLFTQTAYKHGQQEKKEAAASRKRKQLATLPSSAAKRDTTDLTKEPDTPSLMATNDPEVEEQLVQGTSSAINAGSSVLCREVIQDKDTEERCESNE